MPRRDIAKDGIKTRFSKENPPPGKGRPEGVRNRSTILKKWLTAELDIVNPITKGKQRGTVEDEVMLALITKARTGDVPAIKEVLDTMYGKLTDKIEVTASQAARDALQSIVNETGLPEEKARQIVASRFGISEQELISSEVM
jgi:hypothetical protein